MINSSALPFGERRLYLRKPCSRMIQIDDRNDSYSGQLKDLAVGGAFIEPAISGRTTIGRDLVLTIPFRLRKGYLTVKAKVAWAETHGMGVRFISPSIDE